VTVLATRDRAARGRWPFSEPSPVQFSTGVVWNFYCIRPASAKRTAKSGQRTALPA